MIALLLGCFSGGIPGDDVRGDVDTGGGPADSADSADTGEAPWEDPLDPDAVHVLVGSTPGEGTGWPALAELGADLTDRWSLSFDDDAGTAGAIRHPDGRTTYARTWPPPSLGSAIETVDADGALLAHLDEVFARVSFVHGIAETPDGDWVIADTLAARLVAVDPSGAVRWDVQWNGLWPNGVTLHHDGVDTWMGVTLLYHDGTATTDRVELWRLRGRDEEPEQVWTWPAAGDDATGTWPHGPHFDADGTLYAMLAGRGQLVGFADGAEAWRVPEAPAALAFARDAAFLPDGSLVVADAAAEVLRVADPFGAFRVVQSRRAPGVYCVHVLDCATEACLGG